MTKKPTAKRVYHHYASLEEFAAGMWKRPTGEPRVTFITKAEELMNKPHAFGAAMRLALSMWPRSCEHNLTSLDSNRIAWLGHAGCCVATGSPEECTRAAWHRLTPAAQDEANRIAAVVLREWDVEHLHDVQGELWR